VGTNNPVYLSPQWWLVSRGWFVMDFLPCLPEFVENLVVKLSRNNRFKTDFTAEINVNL